MASREPQWLDERELAAWVALIKLSARLVSLSDSELRRAHDITGRDYEMLHHLGQHADGLRVSDLGHHIDDSSSCITHRVNRLCAAGLVEKSADPDDGRARRVAITELGTTTMRLAAPAHVARVRRWVFDGLTATDVAHLARIGARLNDHLRAVEPIERPPESQR